MDSVIEDAEVETSEVDSTVEGSAVEAVTSGTKEVTWAVKRVDGSGTSSGC